jgi:quinoprotein glucose dehydrogenase
VEYTGNAGVWAPFSADDELGYVYLPVEAPTGDPTLSRVIWSSAE